MAMDGLPEGVPNSGRVVGQLLLLAPILKRRWRRYREENEKRRLILGVSSSGSKYRRRGAPRGATGQPGGCLARPRVGPRQGPSGVPMVAPSPPLVIPEASGMLIFYIIFPEFLEHF